jgi:hypothetical protein
MTLKNAAANLPFGGARPASWLTRDFSGAHADVIRGFARLSRTCMCRAGCRLQRRGHETIAIENGLDAAVSKPAAWAETTSMNWARRRVEWSSLSSGCWTLRRG